LWRHLINYLLTYLLSCLLTHSLTHSLTHTFTPQSTVLLEKLTGLQPVKKFPTFYGTQRFITAFTSARHLSLSWTSPIQSIPPHPNSWRNILILSSHLRLVSSVVSFPQVSPQKPVHASPLPHPSYMPRPSHSSQFYHPRNIGLLTLPFSLTYVLVHRTPL
jgi:hypothetical protein